MNQILSTVSELIISIGLIKFLLLLCVVAVGFLVKHIFAENKSRIDDHENRLKKLKEDVDACHNEKRELYSKCGELEKRCEQLDFRLDQSLQREKVLSDFLGRLRNDKLANNR